MEYRRLKPDRELLEKTATPDVVQVVFGGRYEICMIGGLEDDRLMCYAVFSHMPTRDRDVYLEYLFTARGHREEGVCSGLLAYCAEYMSARGVTGILSRVFLRPGMAPEYNSFMVNRGFIPLNVTGRMLEYNLRDMLDAGAVQTIIKGRKKLPQVTDFKGAGEGRINVLLAEQNKTGFFFIKSECDETFSRFYVEDDTIHAAIIASRPEPDTLYISAVYMDRVAQQKNLFLILFSNCVAPLISELGEDAVRVIVMLNSESSYNGLMKIFNPPEDEYLVLEHMMQL